MTYMARKITIIVAIVLASILVVGGIVAAVLFIPLNGKENTYMWHEGQEFNLEKDTFVIEKKAGEEFKILQLTDLQLWASGKDNKRAFEVASEVIDKSEPDLVVLTGDNVSGVTAPYLLKDVIKFFESEAKEHNFYWAPVFGNHDNEVKATPNWSADQYEKVSIKNGGRCLFAKGPNNLGDAYGDTVGNYVITIKEEGKIVQTLYMIDNSVYANYSDEIREEAGRANSERPITYAQSAWYKWNQENINKLADTTVPNMVFTHFASYDAGIAFDKYVEAKGITTNDEGQFVLKNGSVVNKLFIGEEEVEVTNSQGEKTIVKGLPVFDTNTVDNSLIGENGVGGFKYRPGTPLISTGFDSMAKDLGMIGWFFGHDHENDGVIMYNDIIYGYGLKVGPSPKPWNGTDFFGGTVISFNNDASKINVKHEVVQKSADYWK